MDISTPKAVLIAAKARIDTPDKWGQGYLKNTDTGCLCALGAIIVASGLATDEEMTVLADPFSVASDAIWERIVPVLDNMPAVHLLAEATNRDFDTDVSHTIPIWEFNDGATHACVMELFDDAIAKA